MRCWLGILVIALLPMQLQAGAVPKHKGAWSDKYDGHFRKYAKHYFGPHFDWHWFKAQGVAESNLNPKARSHVGARGVMQILPSTFEDIKDANPHFVELDDPRWNIAAGIYYDRYLYVRWKERMRGRERLYATLASYNAGLGRINIAYRRARKQEPEVKGWNQLAPHSPRETQGYVSRISQIKSELGPSWRRTRRFE